MSEVKSAATRKFGIDFVGDIEWGTHLCQFYQTKKDLTDILVPYFAEGLRNNEFCMWVTSPPLEAAEARRALRKAVADLDERIERGQIEILSYEDWYLLSGEFDADKVLQGWVDREKNAVERGFEGLRLTGNTFWIERNNWKSFANYEAMISDAIGSHRMIALCTYSLRKCTGNDVIDVMRNHVGTLIRKGKTWSLVEDFAERKKAEEEIRNIARFPFENPTPVLRIARDGMIMYSNPAGLPFLNERKCRVGELAPDNWRTLVAHSLSFDAREEFEENYENSVFSFLIVPISASGYANIYGRDITESKRAEEALRQSAETARQRAEELEKLMDVVPNALWVSRDPFCQVITGNAAANRFYEAGAGENVSAGSATGGEQDVTRRFFRDGKELKPEELPMQEAAIKGFEIRNSELDVLLPSGRTITILGNASPLRDAEGKVRGCVASFMDITERKRAEQALQESQKDLNRAQSVAKTGSWRLDVRRDELRWSDETYRMFGITNRTPMTYETFLGAVHPEDRGYVDQKWKEALNGAPYDIEHRIVAEEKVKWVRERAELEFSKDGALLGGFGTVQDITERKQIENALKETSEYLENLLNYANAPIIVWDPEFRITKFNHAFEHLSGYTAEEVLGKHLSVLFPETSRQESLTEIQHTLAGEQWEVVEIPILRRDGEVRTVLWNSANIHAADGKTLMAIIAQGQDITERKQLEEKLFQSERKYRSLYETSLDGIVSVDMEGHITECNDAYAQMLGYSKDELRKMTYIQLTPEKWHQMEQEIVREQVTKRGHSDLYEKEYVRKDGSIAPTSIRTWLVRDEKWMPIGMWAIVRDITQTKQLEDELKRHSEHLERLVEERTRKLKEVERLAAIGETAAMVGHDIRNPLQTIEGSVYLAKEEMKSLSTHTQEISNIKEMLDTIQEETTYVDKIVSDLQDFARPLKPQLEEIGTQQLINDTLATIPTSKNTEVLTTVEQDCHTIAADSTMMKRILTNLVTNALQAMPNGGKLTIAAFKKKGEVCIGVQDTGQGITDENRAKIFQPLFSTKAKGQGLGLAVVKRLVEAHNGTITFESEIGRGTKFTVTIPLTKEAS